MSDLLSPVESAIRQRFIPALTGQPIPGNLERELFALPTRLGGLGLANTVEICDDQYAALQKITAPSIALIIQQRGDLGNANGEVQGLRPYFGKNDDSVRPT